MKKQPVGRPPEHRVKLTCYVLPATAKRIAANAAKAKVTLGKAVDAAFQK